MGDVFVQIAGGTPEGIVAAIMLGFPENVYVDSEDREVHWMSLPSKHEENTQKMDYRNYVSPDLDFPERGSLAVEVVKKLSSYIRNFVLETSGSIMLPPPFGIDVEPLQTFIFMQVTGKVIDGPSKELPQALPSPRLPRPRPARRPKPRPRARPQQ
jgi:hypothetical protein